MSLRGDLMALERGFWERAAGDGRFYAENMAHDGLCVLPVGILDRTATIDAIESAPAWTSVTMEDVEAVVLGDNAVTFCYRALAQRGEDTYRAWVSSTYRRHADRWMLVVHQQTPST